MPTLPFEQRRRETTAKLAALMLANAFIFQQQLANIDEKVQPIRVLLAGRDFVTKTAAHWKMIVEEINYVPIFKVARDILLSLPAHADTDSTVRHLAQKALEIVSKKAALRHDLMGRIYHLLLLEAKYLGTYYTSVPAATLLLKLTLDIDRWPKIDWSNPESLKRFAIADLACGTGTLLMAASQVITDNFVKFRASRGEEINDRSLTDLHKLIIEEMLHGYDVLPSAVHLTASTLALLAPETCFHKMRLYSLPMGRMKTGQIYLGSIDYISADTIQTQLDLMSPGIGGATKVGKQLEESVAPLPTLDLCVMNPPFVRSVGGNLLFGSVPDQRGQMQAELAQRLRTTGLSASSTAGLGSVFTAVGDKHLRPGGRLALVLPAAVTTGIAWGKTRELLQHSYVLETVIASHDPERWNFSENTELSEVLVIARKRDRRVDTDKSVELEPTQFVNLWRNPTTSAHALAVGEKISRGAPAPIGTKGAPKHAISEFVIGHHKYGEAIEIPWGQVRSVPWIGNAFAQTNLIRTAWMMRQGTLQLPGHGKAVAIPMRTVGELGTLGPDRRDVADGFTQSTSRTRYPAFWGHNADEVVTIATTPNKFLLPRAKAAAGRPLRDVALLWSRAGKIMIAERSWLNTQRTLAVRVSSPALSNVWWPLKLRTANVDAEKALTLWLNSTLGLLVSLAHRVPTRGAWIQFKKPTIENMPVLDVTSLPTSQLRRIAAAYDSIASQEIGTFEDMEEDPIRSDIDRVFAQTLKIPTLDGLRAELAQEPIITLRRCNEGQEVSEGADQLQFELL